MKSKDIHIGFCENGAGYGGAVISLAAFLEKIPKCFVPHLYTGLGTHEYQELRKLGSWRHLPPISLINSTKLKQSSFPFASTIENIFNIAPYALRFYRAFKSDGISLVYLNNDPSCNLSAAIAGKLADVPVILHARGFSADTKGNRWVLENISHCIAVSNAVKNQLVEMGVPSQKCTVVPEGLDMSLFHPRSPSERLRQELELTGMEPVITLVGGLIDWKGQDILLDACPILFEQFPNAQILLVGSAYGKDDSFAKMIAQRATSPEFAGRVRLLGPRKDIPEILSISTVVLHTSTKPEPFGRTFLEGMAMGKPVIASNEGGPPEVIDHEVDGILIQPRDPHRLAAAIIRLLSDTMFAKNLGDNGAKKAALYSIENHTMSISTVIQNTIEV